MSEAKDDDTVVLDTQDLIDRDENPWSVETFPPDQEMMDFLPISSFDDLPALDASTSTPGRVHFTSPVPGSFKDPDPLPQEKDDKDVQATPGQCGLRNLGNTCFMNAGLQCLLSNSSLVKYFLESYKEDPALSLGMTRFPELLMKVWSGQYASIFPREFKEVLGEYHPQFKDYRQHDCQEFLALMLDSLHEHLNNAACLEANFGLGAAEDNKNNSQSQARLMSHDHTNSQSGCSSKTLKEQTEMNVLTSEKTDPFDSHSEMMDVDQSASTSDVIGGELRGKSEAPNQSASPVDHLTHLNVLSEDSNHSSVSQYSSESVTSLEPPSYRQEPITTALGGVKTKSETSAVEDREVVGITGPAEPDNHIKPILAEDMAESPGKTEKNLISVNATKAIHLPYIEEFYMKDTKTLNTNVLATEFMHEVVQTDSEKFVKHDNINRPVDSFENMNELSEFDTKGCSPKGVKDTNLLANVKEKFGGECCKKPLLCDEDNGYSINNIKRMKIEEDNKNIRMQSRLKVNTARNLTKEEEETVEMSPSVNPLNPALLLPNALANKDQIFSNASREGVQVNIAGQNNSDVLATCERVSQDLVRTEDIKEADRAWHNYREQNNSIIVDTFQGQFKSTVVCSECQHISVTYEPFMYLSLPLPHAMERQISVLFVPCDNRQPIKYLVTLHKNDSVKKMEKALLDLMNEESCDMIIAEVLDNHISRILEENTMLRFVNDYSRSIYAFEMMPAPAIDDPSTNNDDITADTSDVTNNREDLVSNNDPAGCSPNNSIQATEVPNDIFNCMGLFTMNNISTGDQATKNNERYDTQEHMKTLDQNTFELGVDRSVNTWPGQGDGTVTHWQQTNPVAKNAGLDDPILLTNKNETGQGRRASATVTSETPGVSNWNSSQTAESDVEKIQDGGCSAEGHSGVLPSSSEMKLDCSVKNDEIFARPMDISGTDVWEGKGDGNIVTSAAWEGPKVDNSTELWEEFYPSAGGSLGDWEMAPPVDAVPQQPEEAAASKQCVTDSWKSCAICLEEMMDTDLMVHTTCGGTLCQSCLEMSFKHYGDSAFTCPVCSSAVNFNEDFVPLGSAANFKPKTRLLKVPVVYRHDYEEDGKQKKETFGHPNILYLPSVMSGEFLFESVDRVVPFISNYSILLTDGQGHHCSRCLYTVHCSGCELVRETEVILQPGDHLAVKFTSLTLDQKDIAQKYLHHKSMEKLRSKEHLSLLDCFRAFTDSEVLDDQNPWFCPRCKKNQCAKKTISVWRFPTTLVVYLKRFVFHELCSTKIDNKVVFPMENLDLSSFLSGPQSDELVYDLQSCVCHFGGVNAGHYTAYAKNCRSEKWFYYNDETVSQTLPQEDDYSNAYILFYKLKGTDVEFQLPVLPMRSPASEGATEFSLEPVGGASSKTFNPQDVTSVLESLDNSHKEQPRSPESSFDFYQ